MEEAMAVRGLPFGSRAPTKESSEIDRILNEGWPTVTPSKARFLVFDEANRMGITQAREIAAIIRTNDAAGVVTTLITPTGSTPIPVYDELARMHREEGLSFRNVHTFNMDEYYVGPGYPGDWSKHPQSYRRFMEDHFFSKIDIPTANIHFLNGQAPDPFKEAERYEQEFRQWAPHGVHLGFGGVGSKGHVAFNESVIVVDEKFAALPDQAQKDKLGAFNEFALKTEVGHEREDLLRILESHRVFRASDDFPVWLGRKIREADPGSGPKEGLATLANTLRRQPIKIYFDAADKRYAVVEQLIQKRAVQFDFPIYLADANTISHSRTHLVDLALSTITDNSRFFTDLREIPTQAMTIGLGTFMDSQQARI
jgi:6-phosphogluconolactonase/glucosamine-6-phosphate isomerase/deaminase